ncbi:MAG TPA: hypothetical protein VJJ23_05855 [Candidatus Nanoarchaeia archaeon]|nr:hypothetical protein [Candidatus Nanoarchaeia archaeon]
MKNILKIAFGIFLILLLIKSSFALVGVAITTPELQLVPGEQARWGIEIQTVGLQDPLLCTIDIHKTTPLEVTLDTPSPIRVPANERFPVYAAISVPKNTPNGKYTETFDVSCASLGETSGSGSSVKEKHSNLPIKYEVVSSFTRPNYTVPEKPKTPPAPEVVLAVIVVFAILLIIMFTYLRKQKPKKKR